jgi:hypothetical protein
MLDIVFFVNRYHVIDPDRYHRPITLPLSYIRQVRTPSFSPHPIIQFTKTQDIRYYVKLTA